MSLVKEVAAELGITEDGATRALGCVFRAVRMTMKADTFNTVRAAFPEVEDWLRAAPVAGGRTAEMLAIVGPEALERSLAELGLTGDQAKKLYAVAGRAIAAELGAAAEDVKQKLPMLA